MKFSRVDQGSDTILRIEGALDAISTPEVRPTIDAVVSERRPKVIVDLSSLRLIDSSGVGAIISLYKRMRALGGQVVVTGLRDQPLAIFRLLRLVFAALRASKTVSPFLASEAALAQTGVCKSRTLHLRVCFLVRW